MDTSLRTKLLFGFVSVVAVSAALTVPTGSYLLNRMVFREAERRVELGLRTADAMLQTRLKETEQAATYLAQTATVRAGAGRPAGSRDLEAWRSGRGFDLIQLLDAHGRLTAASRAQPSAIAAASSAVAQAALSNGRPTSGLVLKPLAELERESPELAQRARIPIVPTLRAKPGGPERLEEAMVIEAAAPLKDERGRVQGALLVGTVVNGNFEFVDFVRRNVFSITTYHGKNAGTVTVFQGDVRVATNVIGADGRRAVGTRVSAEVHDRVLGEGRLWRGPAFVVGNWYVSAYEPLRDPGGRIIGMLYVGVLKDRYDDMRRQALRVFIGAAGLALLTAVVLSSLIAARLVRPLGGLTQGAVEVARGNLAYQLPRPGRAQHDEIRRLTVAFGQMVDALRERDEQLRRTNAELQQSANELQMWVQNYLDILEFITHELKNQIAAMTINLLAVRDGYVGAISDDQRAALDDVAKTIERSEEMILNYLNLSRIEKGELQVRPQPLHLETDVLRPILRDLRGRLDARRMEVEVEWPGDLLLQADASLVKVVCSNLVNNAAKYGRDGGRLRIHGRRLNGMAEIHVWNDGPGAPAGREEELFAKFTRLQAPSDEQPGTGLGLFITREIVRRHGGDIRADNAPGEWIDFVFTLPVAEGGG
jgi:two-component system NtrC family sensor kinase